MIDISYHESEQKYIPLFLDAGAGIEPVCTCFAGKCLTTRATWRGDDSKPSNAEMRFTVVLLLYWRVFALQEGPAGKTSKETAEEAGIEPNARRHSLLSREVLIQSASSSNSKTARKREVPTPNRVLVDPFVFKTKSTAG